MRKTIPDLAVGQIWRRKRNGALVRIAASGTIGDEWSWVAVEGGRKTGGRGRAYAIKINYEFVSAPTTDPEGVDR